MDIPKSYSQLIDEELLIFEDKFLGFIGTLSIKSHNKIYSTEMTHRFNEFDEQQHRKSTELKDSYDKWYNKFKIIYQNEYPKVMQQINGVNRDFQVFFNDTCLFLAEATIHDTIVKFKDRLKIYHDYLHKLIIVNPEIILVPDANVLIDFPNIDTYCDFLNKHKCSVILVPTMLSELDTLKISHREKEMREKTRHVINKIEKFSENGNLLEGIIINDKLTIKSIAQEPSFKNTLTWLDQNNKDDRFIASVLEIQCNNPKSATIIVTMDINMRNKANLATIPVIKPK